MQSPLDIERTAEQYNLDADLKEQLIAFDQFIWQDFEVETVEQLVNFEKEYQRLGSGLDFCFDSEQDCFSFVEMEDGPMSLLGKGRFQQLAKGIEGDEVSRAFMDAGLSTLEALILCTFRADISEMYRIDAYYNGVPPFAKSICNILNQALSKLPISSDQLLRKCNDYDKIDFEVGDSFSPGFCLTTSADPTWGDDTSVHLYKITPLDESITKARAMYLVNDNGEYQVTFLEDASFRVTAVNDRGEGKKEFVMEEIEVHN